MLVLTSQMSIPSPWMSWSNRWQSSGRTRWLDQRAFQHGSFGTLHHNSPHVPYTVRERFVPSLWHTVDMVPLPKKYPPSSIYTDLRLISLTPVVSKVLEHFAYKWIRQAVQGHFNPQQFGTIRGSSTTQALMELTHYIHTELDKPGHHVCTLLLHNSKAFDIRTHHILLHKFQDWGRYPWMSYQMVCHFSVGASTAHAGGPGSVLPHQHQCREPPGHAAWSLGIHCLPWWLQFTQPHYGFHPCGWYELLMFLQLSKDPTSTIMQAWTSNVEQWAATNDMQVKSFKTKELVCITSLTALWCPSDNRWQHHRQSKLLPSNFSVWLWPQPCPGPLT